MFTHPGTLIELLRKRAVEQPERVGCIFLIDGEREESCLTYGELDRQARAIAALLQPYNVKGEPVLLLYPPGLEYISAFFGCLYAGAIAVPAYPPRNKRHLPRIQGIVNDSRTKLALVPSKQRTQSKVFTWITQNPGFDHLEISLPDILADGVDDTWQEPDIDSHSLAFLQYTSGSTATPKGVMVSHANLLYNLSMIQKYFGQTPESRGVIWLPPYHDMGLIGGILQPLFAGFPVILMSPVAFLQRPIRWLQAISTYQATTSGGPNFAYELCVQKITPEQREHLDLSNWDLAFSGAEPVHHETLDRFVSVFEPCGFRREAFYPCYGLAEATLFVSGGKKSDPPVVRRFDESALEYNRVVEASEEAENVRTLVGCGQTLTNQEIIIVHPQFLTRCVPGQVGEIWVSGPGVAQGYWNRPDETMENFRACRLVTRKKPFLRTGDLGFLRDGELFITGRLKDLIIIRGRNHYPEDIEWYVEQSYPAIRRDCSAAFTIDVDGEERLVIVAEVERRYQQQVKRKTAEESKYRRTPESVADFEPAFSLEMDQPPEFEKAIANIRETVARHHELQVYAVSLLKYGTIPRTSSGKIRRHACRSGFLDKTLDVVAEWRVDTHVQAASAPYQAPRSELEKTVAELCADVFGAGRVGMQDNFFELGGDSLKITRFSSRLRDTFRIDIPLSDMFEIATVADLAGMIEKCVTEKPKTDTQQVPRRAETGPAPLSFAQQRLWFLDQLEPGSVVYNVPYSVRIKGALNVAVLEQSINAIVQRHETLRTSFVAIDGQPMQVIAPSLTIRVPLIDIRTLPKNERKAEVRQQALKIGRQPFDLARPNLIRIALLRLDEEEYILLTTVHHIISDDWSAAVFLSELATLYEALSNEKHSPLPELPLQYADFAQWQKKWLHGEVLEDQFSYWKQQLSGQLPVLKLPADYPRSGPQTFRGAIQTFILSKTLSEDIKVLSQQEGVTLFMILLAAFYTLLYRYTGQEDIIVGSPIANRNRTEIEKLIGFFVNTLVLRCDLSGNPSFRELLKRVREVSIGAYAHQDLPFDYLVAQLHPERKLNFNPLFQVMFVLQNAPLQALELPGLHLKPEIIHNETAMFDLTLEMVDAEEGLTGYVEYNVDVFDPVTIIRLIRHFDILLKEIIMNPEYRVSEIPILTESEQYYILGQWNNTKAIYPKKCIHELFEARVNQTPDAIAVVFEEEQLTYRDLNQQANQLAHYLRKQGVKPETMVGICMGRSLEMIVGILGILKAGGAYLPIDPTYPKERLDFILKDAQTPVVVTQQHLHEKFSGNGIPTVCLDTEWNTVAQENNKNPVHNTLSKNVMYVIYTSGSTGIPKGVLISHQALVNRSMAAVKHYALQPDERVLQFASISFDVSVEEIFPSLISGATIVLRPTEIVMPFRELLAFIEKKKVTVANLPTSYWHEWVAELSRSKPNLPSALRLVIVGTEQALSERLTQWQTLVGDRIRWINGYGPTEATITATMYEPAKPHTVASIPIGSPIENTQVYLLDKYFQPVPIGVAGELYIGGESLARGYLNRPELTAEKFVPDPFGKEPGMRLYKTGDLARYLPDGNLEFLGRIDYQVKIRGFRIEPGEIESVLHQYPQIREAVVIDREDVPGEKRLVAYLRPQPSSQLTIDGLRNFLKEKLPDYMIPAAFVMLERFPLNPGGKVDRRALPAPDMQRLQSEASYVAPRNEEEKQIVAIWQELLGIQPIGIHDDFFELGGHSLLAVQVNSRMNDLFQIDLPASTLFEVPTVAGLVEKIETLRQAASTSPAVPEKSPETEWEEGEL